MKKIYLILSMFIVGASPIFAEPEAISTVEKYFYAMEYQKAIDELDKIDIDSNPKYFVIAGMIYKGDLYTLPVSGKVIENPFSDRHKSKNFFRRGCLKYIMQACYYYREILGRSTTRGIFTPKGNSIRVIDRRKFEKARKKKQDKKIREQLLSDSDKTWYDYKIGWFFLDNQYSNVKGDFVSKYIASRNLAAKNGDVFAQFDYADSLLDSSMNDAFAWYRIAEKNGMAVAKFYAQDILSSFSQEERFAAIKYAAELRDQVSK